MFFGHLNVFIMKKYFWIVLKAGTGLLVVGCSKSDAVPAPTKIDNVFIYNQDGTLFDQLKYDATTGQVLEAMPKIRTRTVTEKGKFLYKRINSTGGWNYYCETDPDQVCYTCNSCTRVHFSMSHIKKKGCRYHITHIFVY